MTTKYHYVANGKVVAIDEDSSTGTESRYLHSDRLGSASVLTDELGLVLERMSYDIWGQIRPMRAGSNNTVEKSLYHTKGYTGHEALADVDLVHMNGRIYDPILGRFMSADPFVQFAYNSQSYNRYSYVLNNPLGWTDPTGYTAESASCDCVRGKDGNLVNSGDGNGIYVSSDYRKNDSSGELKPGRSNVIGNSGINGAVGSDFDREPNLGAASPDTISIEKYIIGMGGDVNVILSQLQLMPPEVLRELISSGIRWAALEDDVVEYDDSLAGKIPRGWEETGKTWDSVPGTVHYKTKMVLVATSGRFGDGSLSLTLHETAHALDWLRGMQSKQKEFRNAYNSDVTSGNVKMDYFLQPNNAGSSEAYAESFVRTYVGAEVKWSSMREYWSDSK